MQSGTAQFLTNFVPTGASSGFQVTIDGSRDKMYNCNSLNLSGNSFAGTINYDNYSNDAGPDGVIVRAVQAGDYLGYVFACAAPNPGYQSVNYTPATPNLYGNILAIRMYDNAADILNWISTNAASATTCGVQIKYSTYGNYPDFISFNNNGIRLQFNPGFGGAVVSGVSIFDPNVIPGLGM